MRRALTVLAAPLAVALVAGAAALLITGEAPAQRAAGCTLTAYTDPPREVLTCPDGLSITAEEGARYSLTDRDRDGRPDGATLDARGLLIQAPRARGRAPSFQIQTPHAVATVRGTIYGVDVQAARTSVFVQEGAVAVARPGGGEAASLAAGQGIDVGPAGPLEVKRWGAERAALFLARFAR